MTMFRMLVSDGEDTDRPEYEARKARIYCIIGITSAIIFGLAVAVTVLAMTVASRNSPQSSSLLVSNNSTSCHGVPSNLTGSGSMGPSSNNIPLPHSDPKKVSCPVKFVDLDGRCYHFSPFVVNDWSRARQRCRELDPPAYLVSIETESEWDVIKKYLIDNQLFSKSWWIGGSDRDKEGQWMWVATNQTFTFNDWCARVGNDNDLGVEHYAHIVNREDVVCWNDMPEKATVDTQFICEA